MEVPWDPLVDPALRTVFNETTRKTHFEMLLKTMAGKVLENSVASAGLVSNTW